MSATPLLRAHSPLTRADFHAAHGVLLVVRNPPPAPPPVKGQPALVAGNPAEGVEILTCGTCLNYYGITEKLAVGGVTNMYVIAEKMLNAGNVVKP